MTPKEQALRLVVIRVLKDILGAADDTDRAGVRTDWTVGDRLTATLAAEPVGAVQLRKGTIRPQVTDAGAFEAWVMANRPDEWETVTTTVTRVRPAYVTAVLAAAKKTGVAVTKDGEEIPGITVAAGDPTVAVTLTEDAAELVAEAWQSGELWEIVGSLLPALEAAPAAGGESS
ncbi:hypothetical protein [Microtetraspora glauca]|uniref:Uncharacterized protein n=1 Tax=Microtetraspora glauca TaxID=1996 RepID=A0ABV3GA51_MICGL